MNLLSDVRFALRNLRKAPVFSAVAVLSLALGIGANTAIFTLIDQLILRLVPVKNPSELVLLDSHGNHYGNNRGANSFSYPMYKDFEAGNQVFSGILARVALPVSMGFHGQTERAAGELVSGSYSTFWACRRPLAGPSLRTTTPRCWAIPWSSSVTAAGRAGSPATRRC